MYYNVLKNVKQRYVYSFLFKQKWFRNLHLKNYYFFYNIYKYNNIKNVTSICKLRIRCIINGRSRSVSSKFRLSRFFFKEFSRKGLLNGVVKY
jgi:ribosomal protein S14